MQDFVVSAYGRTSTYRLEPGAMVVSDAAGERRTDLGVIKRVRLAELGSMKVCELQLRDSTMRSIVNDDASGREAYAAFVIALHRQLAAQSGVEFVRGSWLIVGLLATIGLVVCGAGLAIHLGWVALPAALQGKALLIMALGALWLVVGPGLVWRSRPREYDPNDPPRELLGQGRR